ncbi:MAG: hypothetical protein WCG50_14700 [Rhodoferax sp.]|uniref:hypothetical protein n=1 Tax=Rhodoferax sp. TaxID=50421 RepID=UPI00301B5B5E
MIVKLDWPNKALAPNRSNGRHWGGLAAIKSQAKGDAYVLAKNAAKGRKFDADKDYAVSIIFVMPDNRHRDCDGMLSSLKSSLDGIAQAIGVDDRHFKPILVDWQHGTKPGAVILAIGCEIRSGANLE